MLRAINAMSRAEAQLNDGRALEALVFEREALASLERALDRRRYFLRTLPDRSRIDATRRLTGERREARSWTRDRYATPSPRSLEAQRLVMRELGPRAAGRAERRAGGSRGGDRSGRVALQNAAVALASAHDASGASGRGGRGHARAHRSRAEVATGYEPHRYSW